MSNAAPPAQDFQRLQRRLSWFTLRQFGAALAWGLELWLGCALLALGACGAASAWEFSWAQQLVLTLSGVMLGGLFVILLMAWERTPTLLQLAIDLETVQPAFRGSLLTCVESQLRPGHVGLSVGALSAEMAAPLIEQIRARQLPSPLTSTQRANTHLMFLSGGTFLLLMLGVFGWSVFDFKPAPDVAVMPELSNTPSAQPVSAAAQAPSITPELTLEILVEPPAYSGIPAQWVTDTPRRIEKIEMLAGSRLTLLASVASTLNAPAAALELLPGMRAELKRLPNEAGRAVYRGSVIAPGVGNYLLRVTALSNRVLAVQVVADLAPVVTAEIPESAIPRVDGLPVLLQLTDDFGLAAATLKLRRLKTSKEPAEIRLEIPLPAAAKTLNQEWRIPREGLERWMEEGFEYAVEAADFADPTPHLSVSEWKTWKPQDSKGASGNSQGMLERGGNARPRSLARPNAGSNAPNPSGEDLNRNLGGNQPIPKQLRRPGAEKLEDPANAKPNPNGSGGSGGAQPKAGGPSSSNGEGGYEKEPGLKNPDAKKSEGSSTPPPGPNGEKPGEKSKDGTGQGTEPGGKSESGDKAPNGEKREGTGNAPRPDTEKKAESQKGPGTGEQLRPLDKNESQGNSTAQGGDGTSSNGTGGTSGPAGSGGKNEGATAGTGPKRPRDGGWKSGRELGTGDARMAAPNADTLARMKGISLNEALEYVAKHPVNALDTSFGAAKDTKSIETAIDPKQQLKGFDSSSANTREAALQSPIAQPNWSTIDPAYRPLVEAYLKRLESEASRQK